MRPLFSATQQSSLGKFARAKQKATHSDDRVGAREVEDLPAEHQAAVYQMTEAESFQDGERSTHE